MPTMMVPMRGVLEFVAEANVKTADDEEHAYDRDENQIIHKTRTERRIPLLYIITLMPSTTGR
jgi:hypothetical protein